MSIIFRECRYVFIGLGSNFGRIYFYSVASRFRCFRESGNLKACRNGYPRGDDAMADDRTNPFLFDCQPSGFVRQTSDSGHRLFPFSAFAVR